MGSGLGWNDPPSTSSLEFFVRAVGEHTRVVGVDAEGSQVFRVRRRELPDVRVWVCDVYTLGVADYAAIRAADGDLDAIVTLSGYNQYTPQAKDQGKEDGIGVFKFGELMSALHRQGEGFVA
jgi:hypothetical protein